MSVNLKTLTKMFKEHGKRNFVVQRSGDLTYVTNNAVAVRLPVTDLRGVLAIHPEMFERDGVIRDGIYRSSNPPDIIRVWRDVSDNPDLRDAEDTRLSLGGPGEDMRILALADCYVIVNVEYFAPFKNCRFKATAPEKPVVVYDAEEPIAIIMPIRLNEYIKAVLSTYLVAPKGKRGGEHDQSDGHSG